MSEAEAFIQAVKSGDLESVRSRLQADSSLAAARDENGLSALLVSVYHMKNEVTRELLPHVSELTVFEAAATGSLDALSRLVEDDPHLASAYSPDGFTPLGLACFFGHVASAELLLDKGADPNAASKNAMKVRPLHSAIANRDSGPARALTRLLLERRAEVNVAQHGGWTPLHQAAAHGDAEIVELLLEKGADPSAESADGKTPARMAEESGHESVARLLARA